MDNATAYGIFGFVLGHAAALLELWLRQALKTRASDEAGAKKQAREAINQAYAPMVHALDSMIEAYPTHETQRAQLRDVFRRAGHLLDSAHADHLWAALSDNANLNDLVRIRELLEEAKEQKRGFAYHSSP
ncbi:MAG: hypothetical protein HYX92_00005 [Chloroflexi bacterium]|nr:hypothetical protein [Chloroflexota bacterium]